MSTTLLIFEPGDGSHGGEQLGQVVPVLGALVSQVTPADLRLSTPCEAWTTADLLNHVVGGAQMFAGALQGGPLHDISGRCPDVIGLDPAGAFGRAGEAFGAATQAPGAMERILPLPFGTMTGETFLRFAAFDLLVHGWDLASTLDAELVVPDELIDEIEPFAHQVLGGVPRDGVNFGPAAEAPPGATRLEELIAFTGRKV